MEEPKRGRGRPKVDFTPYMDELDRRLAAGEARETVEAEAKYLAEWGAKKGLCVPGSAPIKHPQIRKRILKRVGGTADAYKNRRWYLMYRATPD
jgi:hypothetical protein